MRRYPWPLALAGVLALTAPAADAQRPLPRYPITLVERIDDLGVQWTYFEQFDDRLDRWRVSVRATTPPARGHSIDMYCIAGWSLQVGFIVPARSFALGERLALQAQIDDGAAIGLDAVGGREDGRLATIRPSPEAERLARGLSTATERITMRDPSGATVVFPMAASRPEVERFFRRCRELAPPADR